MRASELWALSQGKPCEGTRECHWCAAPCDPGTPHDEHPPVPFARSASRALRPASPWICNGCDLIRRKSRTVRFLEGGFLDRQCPMDWGWFISSEAGVIRRDGSQALYRLLLNPPKAFCLALLDPLEGGGKFRAKNLPHFWTVNEGETDKDKPISFTVNNVPHEYTIWDLEAALSIKDAPQTPGVRALVRLFGIYPPLEARKADKERSPDETFNKRKGKVREEDNSGLRQQFGGHRE